jgi:hypothetical protein
MACGRPCEICDNDDDDCRFKSMACNDARAPTCPAVVPAGWTCTAMVAARTGEKTCDDAALARLQHDCVSSGATGSACTATTKELAACSACVFQHWSILTLGTFSVADTAACVRLVDPTSDCAKTLACFHACAELRCDDCGDAIACFAKEHSATGECATSDVAACRADPRFAPCFVESSDDWLRFARGACRDGGDWTKATEVSDAGSD